MMGDGGCEVTDVVSVHRPHMMGDGGMWSDRVGITARGFLKIRQVTAVSWERWEGIQRWTLCPSLKEQERSEAWA